MDALDNWARWTDQPEVRGVEVSRAVDPGDGDADTWLVVIPAAEFVRDSPLGMELWPTLEGALREVDSVSSVIREDTEVWVVEGGHGAAQLGTVAAQVIDAYSDRIRAHIEALAEGDSTPNANAVTKHREIPGFLGTSEELRVMSGRLPQVDAAGEDLDDDLGLPTSALTSIRRAVADHAAFDKDEAWEMVRAQAQARQRPRTPATEAGRTSVLEFVGRALSARVGPVVVSERAVLFHGEHVEAEFRIVTDAQELGDLEAFQFTIHMSYCLETGEAFTFTDGSDRLFQDAGTHLWVIASGVLWQRWPRATRADHAWQEIAFAADRYGVLIQLLDSDASARNEFVTCNPPPKAK